jgi:hypothetical protein
VDDTNILTWSPSARTNCRTLTQAHERCLEWARCYAKAYQPHPGQAYICADAAGRDRSLLQRSASVRCGAVVIIAHAPSHRNTCEMHAYRRRVVYCPPSLRLC